MNLRTHVASVLVAMMALHAGEAWAQGSDPPTTSRFRAGPVSMTPTIELRDLGVDTNVYNQSFGDPVKDFVFTVVPAITASTASRSSSVMVRSTTDFVYFATQSSERSINPDVSGTVRLTFGRIAPFAEAGYLNTHDRVSEEIDARARRVERRASAGVRVGLTARVSTTVRAEVSRMAFNGDARFDDFLLAQELNRRTDTLSGSVRYVATPLTSIAAIVVAEHIRFDEVSLRDTDSLTVQLGVDLNPRALIAGSGRVGYQSFRLHNRSLPDYTGLVGAANLSYRISPSSTIHWSFDRSVSFSYLPTEPYYVRDAYGLSLRRQLMPQWDLSVSGEWTWHKYRRSFLAPVLDSTPGRSDRLLGATFMIGYDVGPRTRFTGALSYQTRESDFDSRSFDGFRLGTSVLYGF